MFFLQAAAGEQPHEPPDRCRGRHLRRPPRASRGSSQRPTGQLHVAANLIQARVTCEVAGTSRRGISHVHERHDLTE